MEEPVRPEVGIDCPTVTPPDPVDVDGPAAWDPSGGVVIGPPFSLTVDTVDGSLSVSDVTLIRVDTDDGLLLTPSAGTARIDIREATTVFNGYLAAGTQSVGMEKTFVGTGGTINALIGNGPEGEGVTVYTGADYAAVTPDEIVIYRDSPFTSLRWRPGTVDGNSAGIVVAGVGTYAVSASMYEASSEGVFEIETHDSLATPYPSRYSIREGATQYLGGTATTGGLTFRGGIYISGTATAGTVDWVDVTGTPTTLAGYGITGADVDYATPGGVVSYVTGYAQPLDGDLTSLASATGTNTLYYRSAVSTWTAVTVGGGLSFSGGTLDSVATGTNTGDQNVFNTISVAGQSNVVADAPTDTLLLVAGTGITITTDAGTDSITITCTVTGGVTDGDKGDVTVTSSGATWTIDANVVTDTKLRDSAGLSVIGNASNTPQDPADIVAGADGLVLRRLGSSIGFGTLAAGAFADGTIAAPRLGPLNAFTDATPAAADRVPVYDDSAGANRDCSVSGLLALLGGGVRSGYTLSNNVTDASNDIDIAAGVAVDSTGSALLRGTAMTKRLDAAWAVGTGQGWLDTGAEAGSTWYHAFAILKDSDFTVDYLCSVSATAPTMPAGYTLFCRIGAFYNGSGSVIKPFVQDGDQFTWLARVLDVNATNPGTSAVLRTLSVPAGLRVLANIVAGFNATTPATDNPAGVLITDPSTTDVGASTNDATILAYSQLNNFFAPCLVRTNTSSQVRSRLQISTGGTVLNIITGGWIDPRGKD